MNKTKRVVLIDDDEWEFVILERKFPEIEFHWYINYRHARDYVNKFAKNIDLILCDLNGVSFFDVKEDYDKLDLPKDKKWVVSGSTRKPEWTNGNFCNKDEILDRLRKWLDDAK